MTTPDRKVAFISGANRGIGFEVAKKLGEQGIALVLGVRELGKGEAALAELRTHGVHEVSLVAYDAARSGSARAVHDHIAEHHGKLDILINNAGLLREELLGPPNASTVSRDVLEQTFAVNLFAVIELTQALLPLVRKAAAGRIVNVSSILGSLTLHALPESPIAAVQTLAYDASKAALNSFTIHLAHELRDTPIKVNSAHPGWVKTPLGGPAAPMELADSWKTAVRLATLDAAGPTGGFFHEGDVLPW